jgi:dihydropyrimidine dehydrogenase (NAD+) subunit PreT
VELGTSVSLDDLRKGHDAVFLGLGLGADTMLEVPGAGLAGIHGAVDFIERFKLGTVDLAGVRRAAVIGGGNTAIDAVRELHGLGVPHVTMIYRGDEAKMSGYAHEWAAAKQEGVHAAWRVQPVAFVGEGRVRAVKCAELDADKRPIAGQEREIEADLVLLAIGQAKLAELVAGLPGVKVDRGRVVVDARQSTGEPGVFAGGDCANGGKEVVNAAAEGKAAARAIHEYLSA